MLICAGCCRSTLPQRLAGCWRCSCCTPQRRWCPYLYYCRNWDYGYGHYNGYGARLAGVFFAWGWLRWPRLRWWDWGGLAALAAYTLLVPGCRGAGIAMVLLLVLFLLQRALACLF